MWVSRLRNRRYPTPSTLPCLRETLLFGSHIAWATYLSTPVRFFTIYTAIPVPTFLGPVGCGLFHTPISRRPRYSLGLRGTSAVALFSCTPRHSPFPGWLVSFPGLIPRPLGHRQQLPFWLTPDQSGRSGRLESIGQAATTLVRHARALSWTDYTHWPGDGPHTREPHWRLTLTLTFRTGNIMWPPPFTPSRAPFYVRSRLRLTPDTARGPGVGPSV